MISEALRLVRVFHDINQSKLASKLGISRSHLSEIESGKKNPSFDLIDKYSEVFNIPPSSLLYFSEQLASNNFAEKARVSIANKIIKILDWISDVESTKNAISTK